MADTLAKAGLDQGDQHLDRECPDIEFWHPGNSGERQLLNFLGWRAATTRHSNAFAWDQLANHYRHSAKAASTQSLVRKDRARPDLCMVLQNRDRRLEERAIRRMIQARGFNTPVQAVLSRNSGGRVSGFCPFCKVAIETLGHCLFECKQFKDARSKAHNMVADATIESVHTELRKQWSEGAPGRKDSPLLWLNTAMRTIFPQLWFEKEGEFTPDGLIVDHWAKTVHILELTRGMEADEQKWRDKVDIKIAAYHATGIFLQREFRGYRILQSTYVIGALGSVIESEWRQTLEGVGLCPRAIQRVTRAAMSAAVAALDMALGARQTARANLGGVEAGFSLHPSQRGRPPAP